MYFLHLFNYLFIHVTYRAPYAAYVKEILFAPEDGHIAQNMSS